MWRVVYVAGPYAGRDEDEVARNIDRAVSLGRWLVEGGLVALVPHVLGRAGLYGDPFEQDDGTCRERALANGSTLAGLVGCGGGGLAVILREDGSMSTGTALERSAYNVGAHESGHTSRVVAFTWEGWSACHELGGLENMAGLRR